MNTLKHEFKLKCLKCGSFMVKAGKHRQVKGLFQRWKCQKCGSIRLGEKIG